VFRQQGLCRVFAPAVCPTVPSLTGPAPPSGIGLPAHGQAPFKACRAGETPDRTRHVARADLRACAPGPRGRAPGHGSRACSCPPRRAGRVAWPRGSAPSAGRAVARPAPTSAGGRARPDFLAAPARSSRPRPRWPTSCDPWPRPGARRPVLRRGRGRRPPRVLAPSGVSLAASARSPRPGRGRATHVRETGPDGRGPPDRRPCPPARTRGSGPRPTRRPGAGPGRAWPCRRSARACAAGGSAPPP
jgi:hypothetical protein